MQAARDVEPGAVDGGNPQVAGAGVKNDGKVLGGCAQTDRTIVLLRVCVLESGGKRVRGTQCGIASDKRRGR